MDIVVSGVKNCTGVSFELQYNAAKYVVFSNWKARDLGLQGTFAYDLSDTASDKGSVHLGSLSGTAVTDPGIDNPVAVHLDFVVRPDAPNALPISFNFVHAQAVSSDSGGRIVSLSSSSYNVTVHGFVKVWPGDADNNGVVDSRDATTVGAYLKQGSGASNVRGYHRDPSSTLWMAQPALVWDSSKATYADCDGSGDVTLSDNLVVQINFGYLHSIIKNGSANDIQSVHEPVLPEFPHHAASMPRQELCASLPMPLAAAAFELQYPQGAALPLGFESDDPEVVCSLFDADAEHNRVFLTFGSVDRVNRLKSGLLGRLVYAADVSTASWTQALGSSGGGSIVSLKSFTSVDTEIPNSEVELSIGSGTLRISNANVTRVEIVDILGRRFLSTDVVDQANQSIDISALPSGTYMLLLSTHNSRGVRPLSILR